MDPAKDAAAVAAIFSGSPQNTTNVAHLKPAGSAQSITRTVLLVALIAVALGALLGLVVLVRIALRDRRPLGGSDARGFASSPWVLPYYARESHLPARRESLRVYGDRLRFAFDQRGIELLIVGLGLAAAIALGALVAG